jgi:hypothetical protein
VSKDWWDIAQELFFYTILSEDPYPVDVDKLSEESYKEAHEILSTAIKKFEVSKAAIHTISIRMFQALFSSTNNQPCGSRISRPSALR